MENKNNFLDSVICELRFPAILSIDSIQNDNMASFQNELRKEFPLYERIEEPHMRLDMRDIMVSSTPEYSKSIAHKFGAEQEKEEIVILKNDTLTISTDSYKNWDEFRQLCNKVITIFHKIFAPTFYQRIGVRYINFFEIDIFEKYEKILKSQYLGFLYNWAEESLQTQSTGVVRIGDSDAAQITLGLTVKQKITSEGTEDISSRKKGIIFDMDFFNLIGTIGYEEVMGKMEKYHKQVHDFVKKILNEDVSNLISGDE